MIDRHVEPETKSLYLRYVADRGYQSLQGRLLEPSNWPQASLIAGIYCSSNLLRGQIGVQLGQSHLHFFVGLVGLNLPKPPHSVGVTAIKLSFDEAFFDILHRCAAVLWHFYALRVALTRATEFVLCARTWHTGPSMHNRNWFFSPTHLTNQPGYLSLRFFTNHPVATDIASGGAGSVISSINPIAPSVQKHPGPILQLSAVFWHSTSSAISSASASPAQRSI